MADRLAAPEDLASLLERDDLDAYKAGLLIECATAVVQETAGQRIVQATSTVTLEPGPGRWLWLPQLPVVSVASVDIDGTALASGDYQVRGHRLWRESGWQLLTSPPSLVTVAYTHGYAEGAQELQRARQAVLALAAAVYDNPSAKTQERIDDYAAAYEAMSARMEAAPYLRDGLRRYYGRSAGLITIGG